MDAIVMLRDDHKKVEAMFKKLEKDDLSGVPEICSALTEHAFIEEEIFYRAVPAELDGALDDVLDAIEEHQVVKHMISELQALAPQEERYEANAIVLMEMVRHHVEEEEQEMFPEVRDALGRKRLVELGMAMDDAKASMLTTR